MNLRFQLVRLIAGSALLSSLCLAQGNGQGKGGGTPSGNAGGGGGSLSGVFFQSQDLPQVYVAGPPPATNLIPHQKQFVLCYILKNVQTSGSQPFFLELRPRPLPPVAGAAPPSPITAALDHVCSVPDDAHPLVSGTTLVVAVDASQVTIIDRQHILAIGLNVTSQAGTAVTPAPVRGSMAPGAVAAAGVGPPPTVPDAFFIEWPVKLSGDTIPTVTMAALYRPPDSVQATTTAPPPKDATANAPLPGTPPLGGASATSSVATRTTPYQDQFVSLLNLVLPQVHPLYYYNVATGVVVSTLRNPTFTRGLAGPTAQGGTAQYTTIKDNGDVQVAPVLLFTAYLHPFDAEREWHPADLIPGASFGFSLSSPASSFYFGGSVEVRRNVQFTAGLNLAKITALANAGYVDPSSSAAPVTKQQLGKGAYFGLTLNIDFIKGLFGGGSGGGSKGN